MKPIIIAMIPAREGSERLKVKNLSLLNDKPLISYSIVAAKSAAIFDKVVLNSDNNVFEKIAKRYGVDFYLRPKKLGGSKITSDEVVLDFLLKNKCDILVWVNSISPLQTSNEIKNITNYFINNNLNSLITVIDRQAHCLFENKPINFSDGIKFQKTQDLRPVKEMVYSIMMWKAKSFIDEMRLNGHAILHGKVGYYTVDKLSALIVKNAGDLKLISQVINANNQSDNNVEYDDLVSKISDKKN